CRRILRIAFDRNHPRAAPRYRLLECRLHHAAIGIFRYQRGERVFALLYRIADDAVDIGFRQEAQQKDAARRHVGVGRKRNHRHAAAARQQAAGETEWANSGPRMSSAPSSSACWAAACAPGTLPASSFTSSWMLGALNSASAISAAFFMDWAASAALPLADSGRMSPTLTWPVPIAAPCCGASGWRGPNPRSFTFIEQAAASAAPMTASTPRPVRRPQARWGRPDMPCTPPGALRPSRLGAYCGRMVNRGKRMKSPAQPVDDPAGSARMDPSDRQSRRAPEQPGAAARRYVLAGQSLQAPPLPPALYVVATPIGHLGDITLRALEVLAAAAVIACEDTRVTRRLTDRYGIATRLTPYHDHNTAAARPKLLARLAAGEPVALVSDAGTPLISDPGYRLVQAVRAAGHAVTAIPGASAVLAALAVAGLPTDRFFFAGFLPPKQAARRARV